MATLRIGLLGLGTVGTAVVRLLAANRELIESKVGASLTLVRALVRDTRRQRDLGGVQLALTDQPGAVVDDPDIDLVIEVMGGTGLARDLILRALRAGKSVVTANKDVMAEFGAEVFAAAEAGGTDVHFEASVAGGIPIIRALKESLAANRIESVLGIINGTTNYILTKMTQEGKPFAAALQEAQQLGYAEADPSADVDGLDAARKLAILASIAFVSRVTPADVYTEGIAGITPRDIEHGQRFGWVVKLLAVAKERDGAVEARVHPTFVPRRHPLAAVNGALNAVFVAGDAVGETMYYGRGAGGAPTASSVLGDVITAARSTLMRTALGLAAREAAAARDVVLAAAGACRDLGCTCYGAKPVRPMAEVSCHYYLRLRVYDRPGVLARVASCFGQAQVNIAQVLQEPDEATGMAELVLVTHQVPEGRVQDAMARLQAMPEVQAVESRIRIEA